MLLIGGNRQIGTVFGVHLRHVGRGCAKLLCHDPVPLLLVTQCGLAVVDSGDRSTTRLVKQRSPRLGRSGNSLGLELQAAAMQLSDAELANRIIKLNTLAHLRSQLALRQEWEAQHVTVSSALPTEDQVASYEALIDF